MALGIGACVLGMVAVIVVMAMQGDGETTAEVNTPDHPTNNTDADSGEIVGAHMIGPDVTELLAEIGVVKTLEGTPDEISWTTHAHPTLSEALMEAALSVEGEAIHGA